MLTCCLPSGPYHGWGVCGDQLARALAARVPVERLDGPPGPARRLAGPLLQAVTGAGLEPLRPDLSGDPHVGYTFFEDDLVAGRAAAAAARTWDRLAAGSSWCAEALAEHGFTRVTAVLQGVDHRRFNPSRARRRRWRDRFVVFSGGKLELRKAHDVVLRAFKVLHDRHPDTLLLAAWHNPWPATVETLAGSPYLQMPAGFTGVDDLVGRLAAEQGIDPGRLELVAPRPYPGLAEVYGDSDVGLFPNRCEGGTNLVLCEYMACGRPVVAASSTGQRDVVAGAAAVELTRGRPVVVERDGVAVARWVEPDLEEVVEGLEWTYRHRGRLPELGLRAAAAMAPFTWEAAADRMLELMAR